MRLVNCIELSRVCDVAIAPDVYRLLPRTEGESPALCVVRRYTEEFGKTGEAIVPFRTAEDARTALRHIAGRSIGSKPVGCRIVSQGSLLRYETVNVMVENPENCLRYFSFPPGTSAEETHRLFANFRLRHSFLGPPIVFSPSKKCAIVEFESKDEAHRAYRRLCGKEVDSASVSASGRWPIRLELLL